MHQLFSPGTDLIVRVFRYLVELEREIGAYANLRIVLILLSILDNHSLLAPVCHEWSRLLSQTQTLRSESMHLKAFGCHGSATEIFARCRVLKKLHIAAWSLDASLCRRSITECLRLPWRLRVARLNKYLQRSDTFSREIIGERLACAQNFLTPPTISLLQQSIAEFSEGARNPIGWRPASRRYSEQIYMQYELLNFKSARHREFAPDEFVACFRDVSVDTARYVHREYGYCWSVTAVVQLSSVLCLPPRVQHEFTGKCLFNFRDETFGAGMVIFFDPSLDMSFDFVRIPP